MNPYAQTAQWISRQAWLAPIVVRVIVGFLMLAHGIDKVSGGTSGIAGFGEFLTSAGFPAGVAWAWLVTLLELVGGAMLILGLMARPIAVLMTVELLVAITIATGGNGLISGEQGVGFERDLTYIMGFLVVILAGPGRFSLDRLLRIESEQVTAGTVNSR